MSGWRTRLSCAGTLCGLAGAWLLGAGCFKREASADSTPFLRISQRNEPATLDPQQATLPDEFFIIRALGEGLVTPNPTGGVPLPAGAERWETSADGLTWTFHLRPDAKWSNGDPVTAHDFVATYQEALTPTRAAPKASLFFTLKNARALYTGSLEDIQAVGVSAPDARTLVLTLEKPNPDFLALVASGPWIPRHRNNVGHLTIEPENVTKRLSNGPFVPVEWRPNQRIVVRKNPLYREADRVKIPGIEFLAFDSGDTEERAFRAGQVDITLAVPTAKLDSYRDAQPPVLHTVPLAETRYLAVNVTRPPLNDPRVRRALSLALDRTELVTKVLKAGQTPALSFVPPGLGGYQPSTRLTEDAAEARRLLAAAGFPEGRGFPKLELSTWPVSTAQLEAIQQRWRDQLGIEVGIVQREARTHLAALAAGDFQLGFVNAIPDYDSALDLLGRFTTGDASNYPHWSDPAYDSLLRDNSPQLAAAESRLLDALPVIPLYFNTKNYLLRPTVRGWREDTLWTRFYDDVSLEK